MLRKGKNPIACLLLHGFTGNPAEMEGLAAFLHNHGCEVSVPTLPGHATQPEDLRHVSYKAWIAASEKAFLDFRRHHPVVFVIGLSMGGALALHLAAHHQFAGVVTLAAALKMPLKQEIASYVLAPFVPVRHKRNGPDVHDAEAKASLRNYDRYPLAAARELMRMLRKIRAELPKVTMPILAIHSRADHVVPFDNLAVLMRRVQSPQREQMVAENSYHVLTVDYDRQAIFDRIWKFIQRHSHQTDELTSNITFEKSPTAR
ncbi:alpha/beta fold hydrolase [candidate division KSB1 bacterium]|nr:alpha/beta fold hydrolase [candidate division KSB1 bacterium]